MITIYRSNSVDILITYICKLIKKYPLPNILENELFIVPNKTTIKWIKFTIANKLNISSNIHYMTIDEFIYKIFNQITFKKNKLTSLLNHKSTMVWELMNIIETNKKIHKNYKNNNQTKNFQFASYINNLFKKYLIYRLDWIKIWNKNLNIEGICKKTQIWQKDLWNSIILYINRNKTEQFDTDDSVLFLYLIKKLKKYNQKITTIPSRFFILDFYTIKKPHISILRLISKFHNIHILYVIPYNTTINRKLKNNKNYARSNGVLTKNINKLNTTNPLLLNWGRQIVSYELTIKKLKAKNINLFKKNTQKLSLLNIIKNDFLKLKNFNTSHSDNYLDKKKTNLFLSQDHSISINICNTTHHEIEILYDNLLTILKYNSKFNAQDICIFAIDIDVYISSIISIFGSEKNKYKLPFKINATTSKDMNLIFNLLKKIFFLPESRFKLDEILFFLMHPLIKEKLEIDQDDISTIYIWIKESNIRWGVNINHLRTLSLNYSETHTWDFGIKRILLGYAIDKKNKNWNNIIPTNMPFNDLSKNIEKIIKLIILLDKWRKKLSKPKTSYSWLLSCKQIIKDFFKKKSLITNKLLIIEKRWENILNNIIHAQYKKKISFNILRQELLSALKLNDQETYYSYDSINFCNINSIHPCIPFKIIYMLGCNYSEFPRINSINDPNDLIKNYPRYYDHSVYEKDCTLFLHYLTAAKEYFYISYINTHPYMNINNSTSTIIVQLINYISNNYTYDNSKNIIEKQTNHNTNSNLCKLCKSSPMNNQFFKKTNLNQKKAINFVQKLPIYVKKKINIKHLIEFWKNPIRGFFNRRLKIKLNVNNQNIANDENFLINNLDKHLIKNYILNELVYKKTPSDVLFKKYKFSGILPYNNIGKIIWEDQILEINKLAKKINKLKVDSKNINFQLTINNYSFFGILNNFNKHNLLYWQPTVIDLDDKITLWLIHLTYCILNKKGTSKILGTHNTQTIFPNINSNEAYHYLSIYIQGYIYGMNKPLLIINSGKKWLEKTFKKNKKLAIQTKITKQGYNAFMTSWNGNYIIKGEKENIYIKKIIPNLTNNLFEEICKKTKNWLSLILEKEIY